MSSERALATRLTGMPAAGIGVERAFSGTVACPGCPGDPALRAGDRITAAACCYENHTWELLGCYCDAHRIASVPADMGVAAMDQAVVAATLEPTGYLDPRGGFHPDALTLGAVEVLDYSPAADGYE